MTDRRRVARHVHPTQDDPVVAALSEGVGGPVGPRAARGRWWNPTAVVLLLAALTFALGTLQKAPCADDAWADGETRYAAMCYSDLPYLYTGRGFVEHEWPYSDDVGVRDRFEAMEYPVGISYWAWASSWATHAVVGMPDLAPRYATPAEELFGQPEVAREVVVFTAVNALGLALLTLAAAWFLTRANPGRPWDAAVFAASPALALTGLVNWDLLAVALVAAALWSWSRGRPLLTGVLLGLGTAAKLYPGLLLGPVLVLLVRARRWRDAGLVVAGAAGAWLLANAPAYLTGPEAWGVFWGFNAERGADLGSVWTMVSQVGDVTFSAGTINLASQAFLVVWCLGVAALGLLAPSPPRLAQLGLLVVVGFLLVNKVYSPQYVLWLLPLAALARPRWRDQLVWQAGEVFYFAVIWWYLGGYLRPGAAGEGEAYDAPVYWLGIVLRMLCELYLAAVVVRDVWRPDRDPVPRTEPLTLPARVPPQSTSTRSNDVVV